MNNEEEKRLAETLDSINPGAGLVRILAEFGLITLGIGSKLEEMIESNDRSAKQAGRLQFAIVLLTLVIAGSSAISALWAVFGEAVPPVPDPRVDLPQIENCWRSEEEGTLICEVSFPWDADGAWVGLQVAEGLVVPGLIGNALGHGRALVTFCVPEPVLRADSLDPERLTFLVFPCSSSSARSAVP